MIALIAIESSTLRIDYGNSSMHFSSSERKASIRRPSVAKFYMEPPWVGRTKVCSQHLGHMTKMAATLIYGGKKIFFSRTG